MIEYASRVWTTYEPDQFMELGNAFGAICLLEIENSIPAASFLPKNNIDVQYGVTLTDVIR